MTPLRRWIFLGALLLGAAGAWTQRSNALGEERRLETRRSKIAVLEQRLQRARRELGRIEREIATREADAAHKHRDAALAEAASIAKLWASRITLVKRLLEELPGNSLPELRLLEPMDWVQAIRDLELDSPENLRQAFVSARNAARRKMAVVLQEALKRFTATSGGELPADIRQLAPFLPPPADAEMLARYTMTRSGKLTDPKETVISEKPTSDAVLTVGLATFNFASNFDLSQPEGATASELIRRSFKDFRPMIEELSGDEDQPGEFDKMANGFATLFTEQVLAQLAEDLQPKVEQLFEGGFDVELKAAVERYREEKSGELPTHAGELMPYLKHAEQLAEIARPLLSRLAYAIEHDFQLPSDPSIIPDRFQDPAEWAKALRAAKVTYDAEARTVGFTWSWSGK